MAARKPLLILGTHMLAPEVADLAADAGYEVAGFVENLDQDRCVNELCGLPVLWIDELADLSSTHQAIFGLGTTRRSVFIRQASDLGMGFATVVHPSARVSSKATVGEGTLVSAGAVVAAYAEIGRHVLLNRGALIGHHAHIGDFVSVQPGANIAGAGSIGEATWIGIGAVVIDRIRIGADSVIGAGAVVTKDVPSNVVALGVPARVVQEGIEGR